MAQKNEKRKVYIQINILKIGSINTLRECFEAELVVKSRWIEPSIVGKNPEDIDETKLWNPKIYIENSIGEPTVTAETMMEVIENETYFVRKKMIKGYFMEFMELQEFPFDIQELSFLIKSDTPDSKTELIEDPMDVHRIHRKTFVNAQEYHLYNYLELTVPPANNDLQLGIIQQTKPTIKATILVSRQTPFYFWNVIVPMGLIIVVSFSTFGMELEFLRNRLQLSYVLVLKAVTFKNLVNTYIPKISYFTYLGKYVVLMTVQLVLVSAFTGVMSRVGEDKREWYELIGLVAFISFFVTFNLFYAAWVFMMPYRKRREMAKKEKEFTKKEQAMMAKRDAADKKAAAEKKPETDKKTDTDKKPGTEKKPGTDKKTDTDKKPGTDKKPEPEKPQKPAK